MPRRSQSGPGRAGLATLGRVFLGSAAPPCEDAADATDSGAVDLAESVFTLGYVYLGPAPPPAPFEACGADPALDDADFVAPAGECSS